METWTCLWLSGYYFSAAVILRVKGAMDLGLMSSANSPPPTYPASRGKLGGGGGVKKGRLWIELMSLDWSGGGLVWGQPKNSPFSPHPLFPSSVPLFLPWWKKKNHQQVFSQCADSHWWIPVVKCRKCQIIQTWFYSDVLDTSQIGSFVAALL